MAVEFWTAPKNRADSHLGPRVADCHRQDRSSRVRPTVTENGRDLNALIRLDFVCSAVSCYYFGLILLVDRSGVSRRSQESPWPGVATFVEKGPCSEIG